MQVINIPPIPKDKNNRLSMKIRCRNGDMCMDKKHLLGGQLEILLSKKKDYLKSQL